MNPRIWAGLVLAALASAQTWQADNGNGTYTNAPFFDEFSDPVLIHEGSDFYLTGATMHIFSNINGQTTQLLHAANSKSPWTLQAGPFGPAYPTPRNKTSS